MFKKHNLKFDKSNSLQLVVIVASSLIVLFGAIDLITYYTDNVFITLSMPVATFLRLALLGLVSVVLALKGKAVLASIILLAVKIINAGLFFIRQLLSGALKFRIFDDFASLSYFVLAVLLILFIVIEFKKGYKLNLVKLKKPENIILVLIALGYFLFFNQVMFAVYFSSLLLLLVLFAEESFIPYIIALYSVQYLFSFFDFFITANKVAGYEISAYSWLERLLGTGLLVLSIIAIFNKNFLMKKQKKLLEPVTSSKEIDEEVTEE